MMRSMFSAIAGLRNHQTFMDVVGNNIANVNTTGFKQSRVTFQDILSQTIRGASSPQGGRGGVNPAQVGLGMVLAGIDTVQTQGTLQSTGKLTDMSIQGDGYFVLSDGSNQFYSRDGGFDLAIDGSLVNPSSGLKVMGWRADTSGSVNTAGPLTSMSIPIGQGMVGQPSSSITVKGNLNTDMTGAGTISKSNASGGQMTIYGAFTGAASSNLVVRIASLAAAPAPAGQVATIDYSLDGGTTWTTGAVVTGGVATLGASGLRVAIATDPDNAVTNTYSFSASPPSVALSATAYDSLGVAHSVDLKYTKTAANTWTWDITGLDGSPVTTTIAAGVGTATTGLGTLTTRGLTAVFTSAGKFDPSASQTASTNLLPTITVAPTAPATSLSNGASTMSLSLDLSGMTQLSGPTDLTSETDGAAAGTLTSFAVGQGGEITGIYSNGHKQTLGQMALASFANPSGLLKSGSNLFATSANSGTARIGTPDSGGRGQVATGFLEMSNVDLAQQFTNMIMAERGFQANSRVITTSDEILQDLVNLKR